MKRTKNLTYEPSTLTTLEEIKEFLNNLLNETGLIENSPVGHFKLQIAYELFEIDNIELNEGKK